MTTARAAKAGERIAKLRPESAFPLSPEYLAAVIDEITHLPELEAEVSRLSDALVRTLGALGGLLDEANSVDARVRARQILSELKAV